MLSGSLKIPKSIIVGLVGGVNGKNYVYFWIFGIFGYTKKRIPKSLSLLLKYNWIYISGNHKKLIISLLKLLKLFFFGVSKGFCLSLKVLGVGYKFNRIISRNWLIAKLGFSHIYRIKMGLSEFYLFMPKKSVLFIYSYDKRFLKNLGFQIRSFRKPETYKYKGVMFLRETVTLKLGKKEQT